MQLAIASFPGSCVGSEATLHKSLGTRLYAAIFYPMDCLAPWQVVYSHTQLPSIYYAMVFPAGLHGVAALITVPSTHRGTNGHCQPQTRGTDCTTATQVHLPGWLCQHAARFVFVCVCGVCGCVVWHCVCVCLCVCAWHCVCHCHCICATVCVYVCVCLCGILPVQNLNLINYFSSNINPPLQPPIPQEHCSQPSVLPLASGPPTAWLPLCAGRTGLPWRAHTCRETPLATAAARGL